MTTECACTAAELPWIRRYVRGSPPRPEMRTEVLLTRESRCKRLKMGMVRDLGAEIWGSMTRFRQVTQGESAAYPLPRML